MGRAPYQRVGRGPHPLPDERNSYSKAAPAFGVVLCFLFFAKMRILHPTAQHSAGLYCKNGCSRLACSGTAPRLNITRPAHAPRPALTLPSPGSHPAPTQPTLASSGGWAERMRPPCTWRQRAGRRAGRGAGPGRCVPRRGGSRRGRPAAASAASPPAAVTCPSPHIHGPGFGDPTPDP